VTLDALLLAMAVGGAVIRFGGRFGRGGCVVAVVVSRTSPVMALPAVSLRSD
jgi:hypothetical protein